MKMGEGGAFVTGLVIGGVGGGGLGYQAGYEKCDAELQPYINSLLAQINVKDQQLKQKDQRIAELEKQLKDKSSIPVISLIKKKLEGSRS